MILSQSPQKLSFRITSISSSRSAASVHTALWLPGRCVPSRIWARNASSQPSSPINFAILQRIFFAEWGRIQKSVLKLFASIHFIFLTKDGKKNFRIK